MDGSGCTWWHCESKTPFKQEELSDRTGNSQFFIRTTSCLLLMLHNKPYDANICVDLRANSSCDRVFLAETCYFSFFRKSLDVQVTLRHELNSGSTLIYEFFFNHDWMLTKDGQPRVIHRRYPRECYFNVFTQIKRHVQSHTCGYSRV